MTRAMQVELKKQIARTLAGIAPGSRDELVEGYLGRIFEPVTAKG